jgi:hypothetical protein
MAAWMLVCVCMCATHPHPHTPPGNHCCPGSYDSLDACYDWARQTLAAHAGDKREYVYTR